jgi:type I site-specific restriction endonuclease
MPTLTEADTCRTYVVPELYAAGGTDGQINEHKSFRDGRIVFAGHKPRRQPPQRADYLLRYRRGLFCVPALECDVIRELRLSERPAVNESEAT